MRSTLFFIAIACASIPAFAQNLLPADTSEGVLDRPLPPVINQIPGKPGVTTLSLRPAQVNEVVQINSQDDLRREVSQEQEALEQLDRDQLQEKADQGERAAQVVLGADFAKEATLLSFAPAAANDALSDAARWYSLAASRGFPGAPSLDLAGIRFYPIRIQRDPIR
ncbi:MAG: hypothetical protein AB8B79_18345 [Granulosicoccus sp.]